MKFSPESLDFWVNWFGRSGCRAVVKEIEYFIGVFIIKWRQWCWMIWSRSRPHGCTNGSDSGVHCLWWNVCWISPWGFATANKPVPNRDTDRTAFQRVPVGGQSISLVTWTRHTALLPTVLWRVAILKTFRCIFSSFKFRCLPGFCLGIDDVPAVLYADFLYDIQSKPLHMGTVKYPRCSRLREVSSILRCGPMFCGKTRQRSAYLPSAG